MWTRNLDVTDGVVNGALGTVVGFIEYVPARSVVWPGYCWCYRKTGKLFQLKPTSTSCTNHSNRCQVLHIREEIRNGDHSPADSPAIELGDHHTHGTGDDNAADCGFHGGQNGRWPVLCGYQQGAVSSRSLSAEL